MTPIQSLLKTPSGDINKKLRKHKFRKFNAFNDFL